jgi:hypothetical protein
MPYNAAKFYVGTSWGLKLCCLLECVCLSAGQHLKLVVPDERLATRSTFPTSIRIVERQFEQLRQKEASERMQRESSQDAAEMISLAAELRHYSEAAESSGLPPDAVKKANELEKLARRVRHPVKEQMLRVRAR